MFMLVVDVPGGALSRAATELRDRFGWTIALAEDGVGCLGHLRSQRWDAVVAARTVGHISGATLLTLVKSIQPSAVRLLVDEQDERLPAPGVETGVAHRVLTREPSATTLRAVLLALEAAPANVPHELQQAIGRVAGLPPTHGILLELRDLMEDPEVSTDRIATTVGRDPMLAAKVLHLANAGFASHNVVISSLGQAAALLGVETLRQVVIASAAFSAVSSLDVPRDVIEQAQRHGVAAARMAASMPDLPPHARTGALLLDIGMPLMALAWPEDHAVLREQSRRRGQPLHEAEQEAFGVTHATAGALLARRWSLPKVLARMIDGHHLPPLSEEPDARALGFRVHHAVQTAQHPDGVDVYDVVVLDGLPAWVL